MTSSSSSSSTRHPHVLVIEDDRATSETLRLYLEHAGFVVDQAFDGDAGLDLARRPEVDLVVLDLMLPGVDGLSICRALREAPIAGRWLPILVLTARAAEADRIHGLDLGADDYLTKPFSPRELVARVRAILRRAQSQALDGVIEIGDLAIDPARRSVQWQDHRLSLTPTEFDLLLTFARQPERVLSRGQLIEQALGHDFAGDDRTVDAHIKNLRRKIEVAAPRLIHTVFGVGYRFVVAGHGAEA